MKIGQYQGDHPIAGAEIHKHITGAGFDKMSQQDRIERKAISHSALMQCELTFK
jgi:hypothetical protein